jgi:hypothetical protein
MTEPSTDAVLIAEALSTLGTALGSALGPAVSAGFDLSTQELQLAAGQMTAAGESLATRLDAALGPLAENLHADLSGLAKLLGLGTAPADTWGPQLGQVFFPAANNVGLLAKHLDTLLGAGPKGVIDALLDGAGKRLKPFADDVIGHKSPEWRNLSDILGDGLGDAADKLAGKAGEIVGKILGPLAGAVIRAAGAASGPVVEPFLKGLAPTFYGMLDALTGLGHTEIDKVVDVVKPLFDKAARAGIQAHILSALAGIDVLGIGFDFGPVAAFLGDVADYGRIVDPLIDSMTQAAIAQPARYLANKTKTPYIPQTGDLQEMYYKGVISEDTFREYMSWQGYSKEWIDRYLQNLFREPAHSELRYMIGSSAASETWLFSKLQQAGYDDRDAAIFLDALGKYQAKPFLDRLQSSLVSMRTDGLMSQGEFLARLPRTQLKPEHAGIVQESTEVARHRAAVNDLLSIGKSAFDREFIDLKTYQTFLGSLGLDDFEQMSRTAAAVLGRYRRITWERPKEQQERFDRDVRAAVPKYLEAYARGDMLTADLETLLFTVGLVPEIAELTLHLAKQRRLARFAADARALGIPDDRELFILGILSDADYRKRLEGHGALPGQVDLELAVSRARREERISGKVRAQLLPAYEDAYVQGWLTFEELDRAYALSGLPVQTVTIRAGLVEAKARKQQTGVLTNDDILAWVRASADYVVTEQDFTDEMEVADVPVSIQERALALVPAMRKIVAHAVLAPADLDVLAAAAAVRLVQAADVNADWLRGFQDRKAFAKSFKAGGPSRTGRAYGQIPTPPKTG